MNNNLAATDAAICRPYKGSLDVFFILHGESEHLHNICINLNLVKPSISLENLVFTSVKPGYGPMNMT